METFFFFTIKSSLCLSAGYLLYYLLLRRDTFHRIKRFVLLGIIFISLLVPLIKMHSDPAGINFPIQRLEMTITRQAPEAVQARQTASLPVQQQKSGQTNKFNLVMMIYLTGAFIQLLLILSSLTRILLFLRNSRKIKYQGLRLTLISAEVVPFCFGKRIIISEKDFREHGNEIILHERTHLNAGHNLDLLFMEFYIAMTWYNPFSWLIRHELKQNHEFEADHQVLRQGVDEAEYQLLLVRKAAGKSFFKLANPFNQTNIKTRIAMMNKGKFNPLALLKVLFFIPLIALMVQVFAQKEIGQVKSVSNPDPHGKYLVLSPEQLKTLGFEMNATGLFYKNQRADKNILCMYFTDKTYSASVRLSPGEKIKGFDAPEKILNEQATTNFDYFPMVVAGVNGDYTLVNTLRNNLSVKLLPVELNMADLKQLHRKDTLVFWFKPTASLLKTLSTIANAESYLQICPPDARKGRQTY